MKSSRTSPRLLALALGLGLASSTLGAAVSASAQTSATPSAASAASGTSVARYAGSVEEAANNKAFFEAVLKSVAEKRAAQPNAQAVTLYYDASQAPSFRSQISSAASIWNSSESNVKLQEASSGADFSYREGNDPRGSYASTNGHGSGYVFLDYTQSQQYDSVRVVTHETGHVLGLPDDYSGPCSELMSGGAAGPSCTNRYPDVTERSRVDQLWATGLAQAPGAVTSPADQLSATPSPRTVAPSHGPWHRLHSTSWR
ncbi:snapalysin [Streptomyces sp. Ag82_O1-15]|uniref:snapalysin n=1 Tax=Streptomyces sp. Ag82_O1-15 TaxID=1938855 RepID=UPI000BB112C6|nr:snapalysin [Streptomyces sp. Ag82_O1-15]PBD01563.1 snapalysin [Streptomyces sp. Ag82_O1-15]